MALKARTLISKRRSHEYDRKRGNSSERGYDAAWQRFRAWYAGGHPAICKACGHAGQSDEMHLDHVVALARGGERLSSNNVQWLCHSCHASKTVQEDGGLGREKPRFYSEKGTKDAILCQKQGVTGVRA